MLFMDTSVAIGLLHGEFELEKLLTMVKPNDVLAITAISMQELYAGVYSLKYMKKNRATKATIDKEIESIEKLARSIVHVDFCTKAAKRSAEIYYMLAGAGEKIEYFDCMIAGTILARGEVSILTRNAEHFKRIKELTVIAI
ncbi:MAG: type II toxin-antitoxin system VapC family toxin [Candidatus Lokiarchaeota archaeon]|nr:type II toxin-antitoxin system VapC family toxin [Candidatus Lokiarchaeota archaeon]